MSEYIDALLKRAKENIKAEVVESYTYVTESGFKYDFSFCKNNFEIVIFLNNSDIGYSFFIVNDSINWEHPENAQVYYPDDLIEYLNKFVSENLIDRKSK